MLDQCYMADYNQIIQIRVLYHNYSVTSWEKHRLNFNSELSVGLLSGSEYEKASCFVLT